MANRAQKKERARAERRLRKEREMLKHGGQSRYARKRAWLNSHLRTENMSVRVESRDPATGEMVARNEMQEVRRQLWGFEVPEPKPWR